MKIAPLKKCIVYALALLTSSSHAFAQSVLAPAAPAAQIRNTLALAATNVGVGRCLPALSALSALGIRDTRNNDVLLDWDRARPGSSPVFSLIGLEYPADSAAMSVTAVPEADGSCSVSAERISFASIACKLVARKELPGYQATQLLNRMMVYTDAHDPGSSVSLIDAPPGCLVIRRYVKFSSATPLAAK
jgi:hypothetical protein